MAKKTVKPARKSSPSKTTSPRRPRAAPLPGMQDSAIGELEQLAEQYHESRAETAAFKKSLIASLARFKKAHYKRGLIEITRTDGTVGVRVTIGKSPEVEE